mmetsp:Transcript_13946/g.38562  ORF Transcript_13946/g.38562 Transcript_13946/m.38562 type:complete len:225 (-) Transcript_13946:307-981(-)
MPLAIGWRRACRIGSGVTTAVAVTVARIRRTMAIPNNDDDDERWRIWWQRVRREKSAPWWRCWPRFMPNAWSKRPSSVKKKSPNQHPPPTTTTTITTTTRHNIRHNHNPACNPDTFCAHWKTGKPSDWIPGFICNPPANDPWWWNPTNPLTKSGWRHWKRNKNTIVNNNKNSGKKPSRGTTTKRRTRTVWTLLRQLDGFYRNHIGCVNATWVFGRVAPPDRLFC